MEGSWFLVSRELEQRKAETGNVKTHLKVDPAFPISRHDQLDIYELHTMLKCPGRSENERLSAGLMINEKIRYGANLVDMEHRIVDRRNAQAEGSSASIASKPCFKRFLKEDQH